MLPEKDNVLYEKTKQVYQILLATYGERALTPCPDNMRELIVTILSHRTNKADETEAFNRMWQRFGSWEQIRDAPVDELTETLSPARFPERKAPYIKSVLAQIFEERGEANIDFLAEIPTEQAMNWLMSLPGVGIKTASLVLLFCFHRDVIPVDTHLHRVSGRLGLIGAKVSAEATHGILREFIGDDPHTLYNFHVTMLKHGQQICTFNAPKCERCPLKALCNFYQAIKK